MTPLEALKKYFGYDSFREPQEEIINSILSDKNVLAVLPTGAGKSICYQIPALISDGISIVVSPLIALMKDQVDSLNKKNKIAAYLNSSLDYREEQKVLYEIGEGKIKLLYVSPEKLSNVNFIELLKKIRIERIFVDEAHCISEWGMDFRPSYRRIKDFTEIIQVKNVSAFTATATPEVRQDIVEQLNLENPEIFVKGFERENLFLNVIQTKHKKETALQLLRNHGTPAIIYTSTRRSAESVNKFLNANKIKSSYYHAGLSTELRRIIQDDFLNERIDVICATNAFGMGIDKGNIRMVIHYNIPGSLENYYQEIGRAGRDGRDAYAYLLFSENDVKTQEYFIESAKPTKETVTRVYNLLNSFTQTALGSKYEKDIPLDSELESFFTLNGIKKSELNSSLNILSDSGYLQVFPNKELSAKIQILLSPTELKNYVQKLAQGTAKDILLTLVKIYGSRIFENQITVDSSYLARLLNIPEDNLLEHFQSLAEKGIFDYSLPKAAHLIRFLTTRVHPKHLQLNYEKAEKNYNYARAKLESMISYVYSNECRFGFILKYFGESVANYACNRCDNCLQKGKAYDGSNYLNEIILRTLKESVVGLNALELSKIIRGKSKSEEGKKFSTFGICRYYSAAEIKATIHFLQTQKFIENENDFLILTEKGKEEIKESEDDTEIFVADKEKVFKKELELFDLLKTIREKAGKKFYQPPQLICRDDVLKNIVKAKPTSLVQLMTVKGVNERIVNKVGEDFVEAIKNFVSETEAEKETGDIPKSLLQVLQLIQKGYSLKELSSLLRLPEAVIGIQIETLIKFNKELNIYKLLPSEKIAKIKELLNSGFGDLRELKENLPNNYSYAEIRIVKAKFEANEEMLL